MKIITICLAVVGATCIALFAAALMLYHGTTEEPPERVANSASVERHQIIRSYLSYEQEIGCDTDEQALRIEMEEDMLAPAVMEIEKQGRHVVLQNGTAVRVLNVQPVVIRGMEAVALEVLDGQHAGRRALCNKKDIVERAW